MRDWGAVKLAWQPCARKLSPGTGKAGKLVGDLPGLVDLGVGVCEELVLGEGHGRVEMAAGAAFRSFTNVPHARFAQPMSPNS